MGEMKPEDTFDQYHRRMKNDFYSALHAAGIDEVPISPSLMNVIEAKLLSDAKIFWAMKLELDDYLKKLENIEAASAQLLGQGYQPNKSDLEDSNPPSNP